MTRFSHSSRLKFIPVLDARSRPHCHSSRSGSAGLVAWAARWPPSDSAMRGPLCPGGDQGRFVPRAGAEFQGRDGRAVRRAVDAPRDPAARPRRRRNCCNLRVRTPGAWLTGRRAGLGRAGCHGPASEGQAERSGGRPPSRPDIGRAGTAAPDTAPSTEFESSWNRLPCPCASLTERRRSLSSRPPRAGHAGEIAGERRRQPATTFQDGPPPLTVRCRRVSGTARRWTPKTHERRRPGRVLGAPAGTCPARSRRSPPCRACCSRCRSYPSRSRPWSWCRSN